MTYPTSVLPGDTSGPDGRALRGIGRDGTVVGTSPDQEVPATELAPCGCPAGPGRQVSDVQAHADWHALVIEQGGPAGEVSAATLRAARGFKTETLHAETLLDERARASGKRASGKLRRAARGES